jgi:prophage tail gpP-like protein
MSDNIYLEVNGVKYEGFVDIAVNSSLESFCSSFSFSTTVKENKQGVIQNNLKLQQKAQVFIDKHLRITGFIEQLDVSYSADSHTITVSGRDIGGDIIDSSILQKSYSQRNFEKLVNIVLKDNGFSLVEVINEVGILNLEPTEIIKTENDESIFDFLDRYAKKLQVLLKINPEGNLSIIREDDNVVKNMLINNFTSDNNILSAQLTLSSVDRFNIIQVYSQGNNKSHTKTSISQKGTATDSQIRKTRRKILSMDTASQSKSLKALAEWNVNLRRAKGSRYICKVVGFYSSNKTIWQPNMLVDIIDYTAQITGTFLIQGVEFSQSLQGSFTTLDIVEKGAFSTSGVKNFGNSFATGLIS